MHIAVVTVFVNDLDRAIDFYTKKLGWEKTMDEPMGEGMRWVTVAPPGAITAFTLSTDTERGKPGSTGVVLEVDDVYKVHDKLSKAGVEFEDPPRTEAWGGWAMIKDSEGNILGLHSGATAGVSNN